MIFPLFLLCLVLSEMSANAVLVLDTVTDKVYIVNFEGGDELLFKGELKETWSSFFDFLKAYFNCSLLFNKR